MSNRFRDVDYLGIILWVFRAVIIGIVIYGTINKIFFGADNHYDAKAHSHNSYLKSLFHSKRC